MNTKAENHSGMRLSVSQMRNKPRRPFSEAEIHALRRVAETLIPATKQHLGGSAIKDFVKLVTHASMILDAQFEMLEVLLIEISTIPDDVLWDYLCDLDKTRNDEFYLLSLIISAAYLYSDEIKNALGYPVPHQNPASMFEIADELSSGILDQVIERGPIFVSYGGYR